MPERRPLQPSPTRELLPLGSPGRKELGGAACAAPRRAPSCAPPEVSAIGLAFVLLRRGGPGELMGRVLAALITICPWSLRTDCGPLRGPVPKVGATSAGFCCMVKELLECKGRRAGRPSPVSPRRA